MIAKLHLVGILIVLVGILWSLVGIMDTLVGILNALVGISQFWNKRGCNLSFIYYQKNAEASAIPAIAPRAIPYPNPAPPKPKNPRP